MKVDRCLHRLSWGQNDQHVKGAFHELFFPAKDLFTPTESEKETQNDQTISKKRSKNKRQTLKKNFTFATTFALFEWAFNIAKTLHFSLIWEMV